MRRKVIPLLVFGLSGLAWLPIPQRAIALTPLTRAVVQDIYNLVQLMPQNRPKRQARRADSMIPGDGLSTGRYSLAQLRFNDGSLARVGEQAIFRFLPRTRNFRLSNGTVLLLIPPGQGITRVRTPSAAAAIRGSALFIRYDGKTDTTVVGALTNSNIEVFDKKESKSRVLKAGQLAVVVKGELRELHDFDLRQFYENSDLVKGLELTTNKPTNISDPAINSVREETVEALSQQKPIVGEGVIHNPTFAKLSTDTQTTANNNNSNIDTGSGDNRSAGKLPENSDTIRRRERGGSIKPPTGASGGNSGGGNGGGGNGAIDPGQGCPTCDRAVPDPPKDNGQRVPRRRERGGDDNLKPIPRDPGSTPPVDQSPREPDSTPPVQVDPPVSTPPGQVDPPVSTPPVQVDPPVSTPPVQVDPPVSTPPVQVDPPVSTPPQRETPVIEAPKNEQPVSTPLQRETPVIEAPKNEQPVSTPLQQPTSKVETTKPETTKPETPKPDVMESKPPGL